MTEPFKVLLIAGWGRSGSTLLDMLLGQSPALFSAGEIRYIWDRGVLQNRPCACSSPFRSCPVWSRAASRWIESSEAEIRKIVHQRDAFKTRHCWQTLLPGGGARLEGRLRDYLCELEALYVELARTTGARVVIDSSKFPSHGYALGLAQNLELFVVHLVRDPRAVAFSWQRKKVYDVSEGQPRHIEPHSAIRSSAYWLIWNATIELLWNRRASRHRYCRVSYEDFIRDPHSTLTRVHALLGEAADLRFLAADGTAQLQPSHLIAGNPARFHDGQVRLTLDEEWKTRMNGKARLGVTLMTLPFLVRYGYLKERRGNELA